MVISRDRDVPGSPWEGDIDVTCGLEAGRTGSRRDQIERMVAVEALGERTGSGAIFTG